MSQKCLIFEMFFVIIEKQYKIKGGFKMPEKSLYKLFYSDSKNYLNEYKKRFQSESTIHLNIDIGKYPAFFCQTPEIFKIIISIERTNNAVNKICFNLPDIALYQFQTNCLIDEIVLTNHIEGIYSTRKEISEILQDLSKKNKRERFSGLVRKYLLLIKNEKLPLNTPQDIRKIYDDIFYEEIKTTDPDDLPDGDIFRKNNVGVFSATGKEIHKGVYPESKIISIMEEALKFLNSEDYDYLLRIAVFHYLFGYIHPFYDGNGRTSRFISSYILSQNLNQLIGYSISYTIKENISKYYKAFDVCNHPNNRGDLTPFVEMFLNIVDASMKQLLESLNEKSEKLHHYEKRILQLPYAENKNIRILYNLLLQAALFSNNGISQKELEKTLNVTYNTVRIRLNKIPKNLLIINRDKRHSFYLLNLNEMDNILT